VNDVESHEYKKTSIAIKKNWYHPHFYLARKCHKGNTRTALHAAGFIQSVTKIKKEP